MKIHACSDVAKGLRVQGMISHYQVMYEHLGSLLGTLITLDEVVLSNAVLHEHWGAYRRLVRSAGSDQIKFGHDKAALQPLEKMLADVEATVMQGTMFMVRERERGGEHSEASLI